MSSLHSQSCQWQKEGDWKIKKERGWERENWKKKKLIETTNMNEELTYQLVGLGK